MKEIVFTDAEINPETSQILDIGATDNSGSQFHNNNTASFSNFISNYEFIAGHNILGHDLKYLGPLIPEGIKKKYIDTLFLSPLLFPEHPYHALLKDDVLVSDSLSNPLNDAIKSKELFYDEVNAFYKLQNDIKAIFYGLLHDQEAFRSFFEYIEYSDTSNVKDLIIKCFRNKICEESPIDPFIDQYPVELAYCLSVINTGDKISIIPEWVLRSFPQVNTVLHHLRMERCTSGCSYCHEKLDVKYNLKRFFGFPGFRSYNGVPLQEQAADAAVKGSSLLAVFPTGGGKSITFQLPALMAGELVKGLTVVISPLQSLMKDQVDHLEMQNIADAVTINGMLDPIERAEAIERVRSGLASLLYISPESLRSKTIEKLLMSRKIVRFVIDEAHCFSAWGQDFRVDYLYIGPFISKLQKMKNSETPIPVSCFTATAKQKVISDIKDYFKEHLDLDLELYATDAARVNLRYQVVFMEDDSRKYETLRNLIHVKKCPTIVYVSRTRRTHELAVKLTSDGFPALPYNGKMDRQDKIENQEKFLAGEINIIVATSAFGMGVDKKDVKLVVHYEISDSLENYIQEAGRAGRDPEIQAECYVLFNENDLDKHFLLLNQTKLSISEIQQVWKAIKTMSSGRNVFRSSALEIAREAGWTENDTDIETRVKTAIAALEHAGYISRGMNSPMVYATSIRAENMTVASETIRTSDLFNDIETEYAVRIMKNLISNRSIANAGNHESESRVDYLADNLGLNREDVIFTIDKLRQTGLLANDNDLTAYIKTDDNHNRSMRILNRFIETEKYLIDYLNGQSCTVNIREINDHAVKSGIKDTSVKNFMTILYFWTIRGYIKKTAERSEKEYSVIFETDAGSIKKKCLNRQELSGFVIDHLFEKKLEDFKNEKGDVPVEFSVLELKEAYEQLGMMTGFSEVSLREIQESLLYLQKIHALHVEGGFLVLYNRLEIQRQVMDNRIKYKVDDYKNLDLFYKQKIQQIHIVGEYARLMVRNYTEAMIFVSDYFQLDYQLFLEKYFKGDRQGEIQRNITPEKYNKLFEDLSEDKRVILSDNSTQYIVVTAGPGSGKTKLLVHKLASLMMLEDVKHEQLLMLTFSRAAAVEFKQRLKDMIGNAANFIEIKTFHSYCFDIIGKLGRLEEAGNVVADAVRMIRDGEIEQNRITKTVLVIDEAQDMDENEYDLVMALKEKNDDMRIIAVGDDDQNIYSFRGSDSKYFGSFLKEDSSKQYNLPDNFRSCSSIVSLTNKFAESIEERLKYERSSAVRKESGKTELVRHSGVNMEQAVIDHIERSEKHGKIGVITFKNEDAVNITGMLIKRGIKARLIQNNDGFRLSDLAELRMFMKYIESGCIDTPVISDELWKEAVDKIKRIYARSTCLDNCISLLNKFEDLNNKKYKSDLQLYIYESQLSDFYDSEEYDVIVSTIHKSKGREFDSVYLMLKDYQIRTDVQRRELYVGMTRARDHLAIHTNTSIFDTYFSDILVDENIYPEETEAMISLSLKGIYLDSFKDDKIKKFILNHLMGGDELLIVNNMICAKYESKYISLGRLSKSAVNSIEVFQRKGYQISKCTVRFIVSWKQKDDTSGNEYAIILPDINFRKI